MAKACCGSELHCTSFRHGCLPQIRRHAWAIRMTLTPNFQPHCFMACSYSRSCSLVTRCACAGPRRKLSRHEVPTGVAGSHIESTLRDSLTMSHANHFVAILPTGDPDARRADPDQRHFVAASLTGSERQSALSPLADMRTNGPLPCRCLGPRPPRTKGILQSRSTVRAVFYFVLLLPQFGFTSVNTRDFAPKVRIAHKHWIESGFRETQ